MAQASAYRDPLLSATERVAQLEREKAELLELTAGVRRARTRRRVGIAAAFAFLLVAAPALAWVARGKMPPPPPAAQTYQGKYTLHSWSTTSSSATPTGPITLTVDPKTGEAHGFATGPIGSVRLTGQVHDRAVDVIAFSPDGDARGIGGGSVVGDAIEGSFGVPKMAASAGFVVEKKP